MSIIYTVIIRDSTFLVEYMTASGNFPSLVKQFLDKLVPL